MATAKQKRGTSDSLLPPRPMVETPGFDGLQIGERTPKRTRTVNRKCYATRGRGNVQGCGDRGGMRGGWHAWGERQLKKEARVAETIWVVGLGFVLILGHVLDYFLFIWFGFFLGQNWLLQTHCLDNGNPHNPKLLP
ncbi:uncharacterized protein LOC108485957 [Gossypium arboreum]|uniref:uncharacterized protein LOC108485957 n=1 Tax=Gossypium arboreum TaxID=29729 RepID=UPI0008196792|nr:uncharacterized protein LOC108485957 [Gossypium arboreum]